MHSPSLSDRVKELDAAIDAVAKEGIRAGGELGEDVKDQIGNLRDAVADILHAIELQEARDREDEQRGHEDTYGAMEPWSEDNRAIVREHLKNAAE